MKETVVISYSNGITNTPSDMLSGDGSLSECVNLEIKNSELVPMEMPVKLDIQLEQGEKLLLVHKTKSGVRNYAVIKNGTLKFRNASDGSLCSGSFTVGEIKSIQYIGNTIVAYTENSPHYFLYYSNGSSAGYKSLGSGIPNVNMSFSLHGSVEVTESFVLNADVTSPGGEGVGESIASQIMPEINKFISEKATSVNKFLFPFLVRYAIRLYDGSYVKHSSPVLMLPSTTINPFVIANATDNSEKDNKYPTVVAAIPASLHFNTASFEGNIQDWKDVISSVDIFVSRQIYTYDQNAERISTLAPGKSYYIGQLLSSEANTGKAAIDIEERIYKENGYFKSYSTVISIPRRPTEDVYSDIATESLFYKFASYDISKIGSLSVDLIKGDTPLSTLEVAETLPDDYMTNDTLVPESSFVYNGRLHMSQIKRYPFNGYPIHQLSDMVYDSQYSDKQLMYGKYDVYVYIKTAGGDIVVKSPNKPTSQGALTNNYLFYPDTDAYKMVLVDTASGSRIVVNLYEHTGLNGACGFTEIMPRSYNTSSSDSLSGSITHERLGNKMYTSEVNNPFHFPLDGIYTIGNEEVIGMAAVTRPISQGQFGEYPLMAFCSDGNYALKVGSDGHYEAISPMQEDVVLGADKITPLEDSVVMITKKGLVNLAGGETIPLAQNMDGIHFDKSILEGMDVEPFKSMIDATTDNTGFLSYLYGSRMAFDYSSNRLLIYNASKDYAYVYNITNGTVSKMVLGDGVKIVSSAIDYPDVVLQDNNGGLYSLYEKPDINTMSKRKLGFIVSKPLKMGGAMSLKTIKQVKNLKNLVSTDSYVKYLIYGSNDNITYYRLGSRYGKPYKYYRMVIYSNMLPKETFTGSVIIMEERRTHKLR